MIYTAAPNWILRYRHQTSFNRLSAAHELPDGWPTELRPKGLLTRAELQDYNFELRQAYHQIVDALLHPKMPVMQNTDGDPLELTTLTYALGVPAAVAVERSRVRGSGSRISTPTTRTARPRGPRSSPAVISSGTASNRRCGTTIHASSCPPPRRAHDFSRPRDTRPA